MRHRSHSPVNGEGGTFHPQEKGMHRFSESCAQQAMFVFGDGTAFKWKECIDMLKQHKKNDEVLNSLDLSESCFQGRNGWI